MTVGKAFDSQRSSGCSNVFVVVVVFVQFQIS